MTQITNVDHIVAVLRQRLLEKARGARGSAGASRGSGSSQATGVQALAVVDGVDDRLLGRALIQDVLAEQFGRQLVNDANFQQVIDRVTATLESDPDASRVFSRVIGDLRASAARPA